MKNPLHVTLLIVAISFCCVSCGKRITDRNLAAVRPDMSAKEVESILGPPTQIKTLEMTLQTQMKTLPATTYFYEQDGQRVEIYFVGDKMVKKIGAFEPTPTPTPSPTP